ARLKRSALGMAMRAGADAPIAAGSLGIDTLATRALAFVIAAGLAGVAGGLQAVLTGFIAPNSFPFTASILFLLVVMVGGVGARLGPLFGAVVVVLLPQLVAGLAEYQLLVFGAGLFVVLRVAPRGIAGLFPHRRISDTAEPPPLQLPKARTAPLEVQNLSVAFGGVHAVANVGFTAAPGAVISIIGPNGAGKTTLLNLIGGLQRADAGSVRVGTGTLSGLRMHRIARAGLARTWQTTQLFFSLSVLDNICIGLLRGRLAGHADARRALGLLRFAGYEGDPARPTTDLPHVDRRLVEIARALAGNPSVLLLDEPAAGLDPADTARLGERLRRIAQSGIAVVLVEHDMSLVMGISDHIVVLDAGRKIAEGPPEAVRADPAVRAAYLGAGIVPAVPPRAASGGSFVLEVSALDAGYGPLRVLHDIALTVRRGETVAVLGPNGAGKSTLMRALSGLLRPVSGSIRFAGGEVTAVPAHRVARAGLVLVPEGRLVFPRLSVRDNLRLGAAARPDLETAIEAILHRFPKLAARLHLPAGMLSGGEQQMLAIARGLLAKPTLLLLDEPSLGLAPIVVEELFAALAELRGESMTLLVVDQMADLAVALADRCVVLGKGRVVQSCAPAELQDVDALHRLYMADPVAASGGGGCWTA
ncbi:MAG TPA: branched-chain amino acid ABC transporter ATP-binding protein/permease, partial [Stellaceae bacterium]|nr:branched-chain amino acid ABC transporter ATP-binding protein/permease [Stellaceae bacterium]